MMASCDDDEILPTKRQLVTVDFKIRKREARVKEKPGFQAGGDSGWRRVAPHFFLPHFMLSRRHRDWLNLIMA